MGLAKLIDQIEAHEPAPCEKHQCSKRASCGQAKVACAAFVYFVNTGKSINPCAPFSLGRMNGKTHVRIDKKGRIASEPHPTEAFFRMAEAA